MSAAVDAAYEQVRKAIIGSLMGRYARRSGQRICSGDHDDHSIRAGQACPSCKAVI